MPERHDQAYYIRYCNDGCGDWRDKDMNRRAGCAAAHGMDIRHLGDVDPDNYHDREVYSEVYCGAVVAERLATLKKEIHKDADRI